MSRTNEPGHVRPYDVLLSVFVSYKTRGGTGLVPCRRTASCSRSSSDFFHVPLLIRGVKEYTHRFLQSLLLRPVMSFATSCQLVCSSAATKIVSWLKFSSGPIRTALRHSLPKCIILFLCPQSWFFHFNTQVEESSLGYKSFKLQNKHLRRRLQVIAPKDASVYSSMS